MKIRWGIRGKLIASMMATLVPFLALSLYWSYRELEAERSKIQLEALRFATSGATIADEFITTTEQVLMALAEIPATVFRDRITGTAEDIWPPQLPTDATTVILLGPLTFFH